MPDYLRMGTFCGLSIRETLLSPPGLIFDLLYLTAAKHGVDLNEVD